MVLFATLGFQTSVPVLLISSLSLLSFCVNTQQVSSMGRDILSFQQSASFLRSHNGVAVKEIIFDWNDLRRNQRGKATPNQEPST